MSLQRDNSGQALLEFAFVLPMLCIFFLGVVDYGRAINESEVIMNLAGEGSSYASRANLGSIQADIQAAANVVMTDADLDMKDYGCAIVTAVTNPSAGSYTISAQAQASSPTCSITVTSRIGCGPKSGTCNGNATIPTSVQTALTGEPAGSIVYVTEVYYQFSYVTPVGYFLKGTGALPADLYAAAYY